nr:immunoglobulin heavy chain junction region [Macaca mulatta]MOY17965.1 immunoglobulin heavy chain junction region [Macaca mulatta]MOY17966.1 immunoglobulin heavy chain junction region [Macaca mulatta]MOY17969.1 immunoglobulin heavy chain junction region [Macaca mulatta]MOY17984.1 immunoglobulin heavy chain junction region [Macaca mulatta]
CTTVDSWEDYW